MRMLVNVSGVAATIAMLVCLAGTQAGEDKVPLDKLPKAVVEAVKARFPDAKLVSAEKETDKGKTLYEVAITNKDQKIEATVTEGGDIVEVEKQITAKDLPEKVVKALEGKYPKATYEIIEEIIKVENKKDQPAYYEVLLVTADKKKKVEVQVAADGKILHEEDKTNEKNGGEDKVPLDKLPKAVVEAVKARFPDAKLVSAEKETDKGKTLYEVAITNKDQKIEVTVTEGGDIVEVEKQITAKDLPEKVVKALEGKYPKATYEIIEEIIKVENKKDQPAYYEVLLVTADKKKKIEVQVAADGKILHEEDKTNEKEGNNNDKDDKKKKDK